jgi:hypothetical protein
MEPASARRRVQDGAIPALLARFPTVDGGVVAERHAAFRDSHRPVEAIMNVTFSLSDVLKIILLVAILGTLQGWW